jgi:hypothetical protein
MEATLIKTDGSQRKIKVNSFTEARSIVCNYDPNGLGEIITLNNGELLLIDEEGKLKNFPVNTKATNMAHLHEAIYPHDYIVGDALLFDENEFEEMPYE